MPTRDFRKMTSWNWQREAVQFPAFKCNQWNRSRRRPEKRAAPPGSKLEQAGAGREPVTSSVPRLVLLSFPVYCFHLFVKHRPLSLKQEPMLHDSWQALPVPRPFSSPPATRRAYSQTLYFRGHKCIAINLKIRTFYSKELLSLWVIQKYMLKLYTA